MIEMGVLGYEVTAQAGSVVTPVDQPAGQERGERPDHRGAAEQRATPRQITILGAGDVLVHPPVWIQARADNGGSGYDFLPMFAGVRDTIAGADLALCHLEVPIAEPGEEPSGFPNFNAPPEVLDGIGRAGFDGCSTASNHVIDKGQAGVTRMLDAMDRAHLGHTGSARNAAEANTPKIYDVRGVRVAHLSYSQDFNGLRQPAGKEWLANLIEPEQIKTAARQARAAGAEVVVLSLHWGTEYEHAPDLNQLRWAKDLLAAPEIDVILGHHAHVVQPFERIGDKWVVYGMGNELASHENPIDDSREGVMARLTLTKQATGRWRVTRAEAVPTWTQLSPQVRLIELPKALSDSSLPAAQRGVYQAAQDRITSYVGSRSASNRVLAASGVGAEASR
jgi:hypothetical protein